MRTCIFKRVNISAYSLTSCHWVYSILFLFCFVRWAFFSVSEALRSRLFDRDSIGQHVRSEGVGEKSIQRFNLKLSQCHPTHTPNPEDQKRQPISRKDSWGGKCPRNSHKLNDVTTKRPTIHMDYCCFAQTQTHTYTHMQTHTHCIFSAQVHLQRKKKPLRFCISLINSLYF